MLRHKIQDKLRYDLLFERSGALFRLGLMDETLMVLEQVRTYLKADTLGAYMGKYIMYKGMTHMERGEYLEALGRDSKTSPTK